MSFVLLLTLNYFVSDILSAIPIPSPCAFHIKQFSSTYQSADPLHSLIFANLPDARITWTIQTSSKSDLAPIRLNVQFRFHCVIHILLKHPGNSWSRMANYMQANFYTYFHERSTYIVFQQNVPTLEKNLFSGLLKWPAHVFYYVVDGFKSQAWFYLCAYCDPTFIQIPRESFENISLRPTRYPDIWRNIVILSNFPHPLAPSEARICPRNRMPRCAHTINTLQTIAPKNNVTSSTHRTTFRKITSDMCTLPSVWALITYSTTKTQNPSTSLASRGGPWYTAILRKGPLR
ncbi:hypothetical protein Fcan01_11783 [Folsomia candida]|uniref:Uncharacterized protein n=1 Tax=Folsomia candida TaxID=158441 RepID=A0A226ECT5_FOLCA|nr:hypothetical protein Fcan01_11783 [Folsomia candida]